MKYLKLLWKCTQAYSNNWQKTKDMLLWRKYQLQATMSFIIFWDFSMFYQIFLSPQVKRWAIITYKYGIYELLHDLPNDLRLRILGN